MVSYSLEALEDLGIFFFSFFVFENPVKETKSLKMVQSRPRLAKQKIPVHFGGDAE